MVASRQSWPFGYLASKLPRLLLLCRSQAIRLINQQYDIAILDGLNPEKVNQRQDHQQAY
jgi:hypothetical protein